MIIRGQSERPYPEFCGVGGTQPTAGSSSYNALQATYTHRWHSGLDLNVSYTWSKFLDIRRVNLGGRSRAAARISRVYTTSRMSAQWM